MNILRIERAMVKSQKSHSKIKIFKPHNSIKYYIPDSSSGIVANEVSKTAISNVRHNFNNPFSAILGYLEMLVEDYDSLSKSELNEGDLRIQTYKSSKPSIILSFNTEYIT